MTAQERRDAYRPDGAYGRAAQEGYPLLVAAGSRLHEAGIAFTDMTQLFAQDTRTLYIDDCCHLGPEGTMRLAQAVAERVAEGMARARDSAGRPPVPNQP